MRSVFWGIVSLAAAALVAPGSAHSLGEQISMDEFLTPTGDLKPMNAHRLKKLKRAAPNLIKEELQRQFNAEVQGVENLKMDSVVETFEQEPEGGAEAFLDTQSESWARKSYMMEMTSHKVDAATGLAVLESTGADLFKKQDWAPDAGMVRSTYHLCTKLEFCLLSASGAPIPIATCPLILRIFIDINVSQGLTSADKKTRFVSIGGALAGTLSIGIGKLGTCDVYIQASFSVSSDVLLAEDAKTTLTSGIMGDLWTKFKEITGPPARLFYIFLARSVGWKCLGSAAVEQQSLKALYETWGIAKAEADIALEGAVKMKAYLDDKGDFLATDKHFQKGSALVGPWFIAGSMWDAHYYDWANSINIAVPATPAIAARLKEHKILSFVDYLKKIGDDKNFAAKKAQMSHLWGIYERILAWIPTMDTGADMAGPSFWDKKALDQKDFVVDDANTLLFFFLRYQFEYLPGALWFGGMAKAVPNELSTPDPDNWMMAFPSSKDIAAEGGVGCQFVAMQKTEKYVNTQAIAGEVNGHPKPALPRMFCQLAARLKERTASDGSKITPPAEAVWDSGSLAGTFTLWRGWNNLFPRTVERAKKFVDFNKALLGQKSTVGRHLHLIANYMLGGGDPANVGKPDLAKVKIVMSNAREDFRSAFEVQRLEDTPDSHTTGVILGQGFALAAKPENYARLAQNSVALVRKALDDKLATLSYPETLKVSINIDVGLSVGVGGSWDMCTPDFNALQLGVGFSKEYTMAPGAKAVTDGWSHVYKAGFVLPFKTAPTAANAATYAVQYSAQALKTFLPAGFGAMLNGVPSDTFYLQVGFNVKSPWYKQPVVQWGFSVTLHCVLPKALGDAILAFKAVDTTTDVAIKTAAKASQPHLDALKNNPTFQKISKFLYDLQEQGQGTMDDAGKATKEPKQRELIKSLRQSIAVLTAAFAYDIKTPLTELTTTTAALTFSRDKDSTGKWGPASLTLGLTQTITVPMPVGAVYATKNTDVDLAPIGNALWAAYTGTTKQTPAVDNTIVTVDHSFTDACNYCANILQFIDNSEQTMNKGCDQGFDPVLSQPEKEVCTVVSKYLRVALDADKSAKVFDKFKGIFTDKTDIKVQKQGLDAAIKACDAPDMCKDGTGAVNYRDLCRVVNLACFFRESTNDAGVGGFAATEVVPV